MSAIDDAMCPHYEGDGGDEPVNIRPLQAGSGACIISLPSRRWLGSEPKPEPQFIKGRIGRCVDSPWGLSEKREGDMFNAFC
jgi:hypothetical protein